MSERADEVFTRAWATERLRLFPSDDMARTLVSLYASRDTLESQLAAGRARVEELEESRQYFENCFKTAIGQRNDERTTREAAERALQACANYGCVLCIDHITR